MIKINRDKKAIRIGELVVVKKWSPKKGYTYSERIGIVMADEGVDEQGKPESFKGYGPEKVLMTTDKSRGVGGI